MSGLTIDHDLCTRCGLCVEACPFAALSQDDAGRIRVDERCTLCGACVEVCPVQALAVPEEPAAAADPSHRGVWIVGEHHEGAWHPVTYELIGTAARLATSRACPVAVVAAGASAAADALTAQLAGLPVATLHWVEHDCLAVHRDGPVAAALASVIRNQRPEIVLAGATGRGRAMVPRLAVRLATGLTADCTDLAIDPASGDLLQTRPAFGGNIMATIVTRRHRPQMATVRPRVFPPPPRDNRPPPALIRHPVEAAGLEDGVAVLERRTTIGDDAAITEAEVLVAGGRGIGGADGFAHLAELAKLLGGELAASRAAVEAGWAPYSRQVGQTGRTVHPRLYIAIGISGAIQHRVGMSSARTIVAVNCDPEAPIFQVADYGIVGDWREVLPEVVRALAALRREDRP